MLWNNPSTYYEYVSLSLANNEADWFIAKQDKVRQNKQPEDSGMKRGRVRRDNSQPLRKQNTENEVISHEPVAKHR